MLQKNSFRRYLGIFTETENGRYWLGSRHGNGLTLQLNLLKEKPEISIILSIKENTLHPRRIFHKNLILANIESVIKPQLFQKATRILIINFIPILKTGWFYV